MSDDDFPRGRRGEEAHSGHSGLSYAMVTHESEPLGVSEKEGECLLSAGVHLVVQSLQRLVHLLDDCAQLGDLDGQRAERA